jgi:hypothetical protein
VSQNAHLERNVVGLTDRAAERGGGPEGAWRAGLFGLDANRRERHGGEAAFLQLMG